MSNMLSDNWDYGISESSKRSQECVANLRREMRSTPGGKGSTGRDDFPPNSIVSINELWKDMDDTFDYRIDVDNEDGSIRFLNRSVVIVLVVSGSEQLDSNNRVIHEI